MLRAALVPDTRPPPEGSAGEDVTVGFEPVRPGHVLENLARSIGTIPRVFLPDTAPDDTGLDFVRSSANELPVPTERGDRYQLFGEIARGGMGAVLKGATPTWGATWPSRSCSKAMRTSPRCCAASWRKRRSAASSSTPASCRCMSWEHSLTAIALGPPLDEYAQKERGDHDQQEEGPDRRGGRQLGRD